MADVENLLNGDNDFFGDTVDTPKEGIEQYIKRECLKRVSQAGARRIYYRINGQRKRQGRPATKQLTKRMLSTSKASGKHVINLYSTEISRVVKIRDVKKLQQDIENNPIIKNQMANLSCLFVCAFGNFLAPVLVAVHTVNNLDLGDELENEDYESD